MLSMTGYGSGAAPLGDGRIVLDIRSVNHRFLDVRVRLPHRIQEAAPAVEKVARERLVRGRIDIGARLEGQPLPPAELDLDRARGAFEDLSKVRDALRPDEALPLSLLTCVPDLFKNPEGPASDVLTATLISAAEQGCEALITMRTREGAALAQDFRTKLAAVGEKLSTITTLAAAVPEAQRQRLQQRLERLLSNAEVELEPGRLEQEVAILADRSDISEEISRLDSHREQIAGLIGDGGGAVGRRLDFLLQEMGREANTLTAKSPDAALSALGVDLKAIIEQMREQAQNIL